MTDARKPDDRLAEGEALSAYLSDELEEADATALEERLRRDPSLARRLDDMAEIVGVLRNLDEVRPPPGFRERLAERIAAEDRRVASVDAARPVASVDAARDVASVDAARPVASVDAARERRRPRWHMVGVAAAALTAVAVAATGLLQGMALDEDVDAPAAVAGEGSRVETFADDAAPDAAPQETPHPFLEDTPADIPAVVRDDAVELPDVGAIRDRYGRLPEAVAILGTPVAEAGNLSAAALASLDAAAVDPAGVPATACANAVGQTVGPASVIVRVESATTPKGRVLVHVVVSALGDRLDRVEVLVVEPATCAPLDRVVVA